MKRVAQSARWLFETKPKSRSSPVCHTRYHSTSSERRNNAQSNQNAQLTQCEDNYLESTDDFINWDEINAESKTVQTAVGALPISPILDPSWRKARERGQPKARPNLNKLSRIQQKWYNSPYANMLAEPVRQCQHTSVRLPKAFLQSFGLVKKPSTEEVWWIPAEFAVTKRHPPQKTAHLHPSEQDEVDRNNGKGVAGSEMVENQDESNDSVGMSQEGVSLDPSNEDTKDTKGSTAKDSSLAPRFRAPVHVLSRQDLLASFQDKGSKYGSGHMRFAGQPTIGKLANNAIWRQDIDTVILEKMRLQVESHLSFLAHISFKDTKTKPPLIPYSSVAESPEKTPEAVLQVRDPPEAGQEENDTGTVSLSPSPFTMDRVGTQVVPKYHLPSLLGSGIMASLADKVPEAFASHDQLILLRKRSKPCQGLYAALWRLQGYMADYGTSSGRQESSKKR